MLTVQYCNLIFMKGKPMYKNIYSTVALNCKLFLQILFEEFRLGRFQSYHVGGCPDGYLRMREGDWRQLLPSPTSASGWEPGQFCGSQQNRSR